jgi:curved DNA-binding protein CbpA
MSSAVSGKYQDHYQVLGVEPQSDSEIIQQAYAALAQKYHPGNLDTGDPEKFEAVNLAYEVLSDADLRRGFDRLKGVGREEGVPKFSGLAFFDALGHETVLRTALLCVLYDRRRAKPFTPSLPLRQIENTLKATVEEMGFALWYLKQRGLIASDDKSSLQVTVEGIDFLEHHRPSADLVMPFIKPEALGAKPEALGAKPEALGAKPEALGAKPEALGAPRARTDAQPEPPPRGSNGEERVGARVVGLLKKSSPPRDAV